ncbi:MAG TPA: acetate kinase [Acholeplasmataceae bacterium]|jgi:acetate kinase|nr:acetate kinase [Acholeplasmataceae bacterium]
MIKVMAINAGSSSLKFKLYDMPEEKVITEGLVERIGLDDAYYTIKINGEKVKTVLPVKNHKEATNLLLGDLVKREIVKSLDEIKGVGHRIVQGGDYFSDSVIVDDDVIAKIDELCKLAPLHNPAHLTGIRAFMEVLPDVPNVVVFDTAFHQTMAEEAYMYALPYEWYTKHRIRKYGAHGTSHQYVANIAARTVGIPIEQLKIVTCHLGNGASIAAVKGGKCVDTSMGLTPLEGIPMGTRSGNIDPAVVEFICLKENLTVSDVLYILNHKSGYLGVSGISHDSRDLENAMNRGDRRSKLALDIQYKRIADYIGSYYVYMEGIDIIVFTAGIGENSTRCREEVLRRLKVLGVEIDVEANNSARGEIKEITTKESKIRAFMIPTNEELVIARDTVRLARLIP